MESRQDYTHGRFLLNNFYVCFVLFLGFAMFLAMDRFAFGTYSAHISRCLTIRFPMTFSPFFLLFFSLPFLFVFRPFVSGGPANAGCPGLPLTIHNTNLQPMPSYLRGSDVKT